jgi:hypothetical protein
MVPVAIDLAKYNDPDVGVLAGQESGRSLRTLYHLDEIDALPDHEAPDGIVTVLIPDSVYSFNSSYFLGLFAPSVIALGAPEFRRRYHFVHRDADQFREKGIRVSLLTGAPLRSLRRASA